MTKNKNKEKEEGTELQIFHFCDPKTLESNGILEIVRFTPWPSHLCCQYAPGSYPNTLYADKGQCGLPYFMVQAFLTPELIPWQRPGSWPCFLPGPHSPTLRVHTWVERALSLSPSMSKTHPGLEAFPLVCVQTSVLSPRWWRVPLP